MLRRVGSVEVYIEVGLTFLVLTALFLAGLLLLLSHMNA